MTLMPYWQSIDGGLSAIAPRRAEERTARPAVLGGGNLKGEGTIEQVLDVIEGRSRYAVLCGCAEDVSDILPDGVVNLHLTDPPFCDAIDEAWDTQWADDSAFLSWLGPLLGRWRHSLASNGSLYVYASTRLGARVETVVAEHFEVLNNIRWSKPSGRSGYAEKEAMRRFFPDSETIIFAEQRGADSRAMGEAQYDTKCDELRGFVFEPIRAYLDAERERAGVSRKQCDEACGNQMSGHYFSRVQWALPTLENYERLRALFNGVGRAEFLRREYEDLRREYEDLRRPFTVSPSVPYTDVWTYATVQAYDGKHRCEKPEVMARDIIAASSRPGDLIFDPFCGSGVFLAAAVAMGRRAIGCDMDPEWADFSRRRCDMAAATGKVEVRKVHKPHPRQLDLLGPVTT